MLTNKEIALQVQLENVTNLLGAKVLHYYCSDHTGRHWRKIELIYNERERETKSTNNPDAG